MNSTIQCLIDIVKINKEKKELFYLSQALDSNGNNTRIETKIEKINKELQKIKAGFYLKYYDFTKVKIIVESTRMKRG